ncbi:HBL/NHE enterotoxin family protein [Deinococcus cellulosilyticus]|uniref:Uncharacterized protein n=1 Tax=Deinococcus cellulosilyticus (strain DSM 18568 / NBRC 106333 / KACC 11606 / 5516J-15) TaxID=1223518 RepID=A0A511MZW4_DEIC1|nr:HBL/NHE enterotoxin family protein [Deinococcus cellulosilyticus]GEM45666.1 hypothetical protein DC3_13010 [Deinococcus cellulosilyticus NBRC 106333 = KACC 11606]
MSDAATSLAPQTDATQQTLTDQFNANQTITAYAHALQNIQLTPTTNPPQQWYTDFLANLKIAQGHANTWVTDLGPEIFAKVPQSIINYGTTFNIATQQILNILSQAGDNPTDAQRQEIIGMINALLVDLGIQQQTIVDVQAKLQQFAVDVQSDHSTLLDGQNSAYKEAQLDQQKIDTINAKINSIQQKIQQDSTLATVSEIGLGVGIFLAVAGFALAVATAGAAAPIVVGVVGVIAVGGAIAGTVIFNKKVQEDLDELHQLQNELSDEQAQVSALQGISNSIGALVTQNEAATKAISDVLNTWAVLKTKLAAVMTDLQNAEAPDLPGILMQLDIQTAQTQWTQLTDFATKMQQINTTVQQPIMNPPAQAVQPAEQVA